MQVDSHSENMTGGKSSRSGLGWPRADLGVDKVYDRAQRNGEGSRWKARLKLHKETREECGYARGFTHEMLAR